MKIKFLKPNELEKPLRLAVHRSGKLGFSKEAELKLDLINNKSVGIGMNEDDPEDESLYMIVYADSRDDAFKVSKAGTYYYLNTKVLFDNLKIDYSMGTVSFEMEKMQIGDDIFYKLSKNKHTKIINEDKKDDELF